MSHVAALPLIVALNALVMANPEQMDRDGPRIEVGVDPRVELLSIVFRLAGAKEYRRGRVPAYSADVDAYFGPYADEGAVLAVRELRNQYGISHDAVVKLAVHVEDASSLRELVSLTQATTLGDRWRVEAARAFLEKLRKFSKITQYPDFLEEQKELYAVTDQRLQAGLSTADLGWLDEYFGEPSRSLRVIPGMLTGRASYGATVVRDTGKDRYAIVGVDAVDELGIPQFGRAVIESVVHELCHSYLKPVLDVNADSLQGPATALYLLQQPKMEAQAYRSGYTVMNETLTRACTNRYLQAKGLPEEVEKDFAYNRSRGFLWIEEVTRQLEVFESHRDEYPMFADFAPELIQFFAELTRDLPHSAEELSARRPRVIRSNPPIGATDVDPGLEAIEVTFDMAMQTDAWSVVGGGAKYPDTDTPSYDPDGKVFRLPVSLEPEREYEFWLNRGSHSSFTSEEGIPLASVHFWFRTGIR